MIANNMTGDYKALESYFVQKLVNIADTLKAESIVWEEVFDNGVKIPKTTLVHIWKDSYQSMLYRVRSLQLKKKQTIIFVCCR